MRMNVGRPLQFDPDKALDVAMQLFWRKGYESTSLHDLISAMGLSKSSFYQTFNSKHQLFKQSIQHYRNALTHNLQSLLQQAESGRAFIESMFYGVECEVSGPDARRGCLLMNTASEFSQTDAEIAVLVSDSLKHIEAIFEQAILRAQSENKVAKDKSPQALAVYLVSNMSGLKNMVKAGADKKTIRGIADITLSALD